MVGWHHQLNGHEFEQALGDREGQGSLACCSPWGHKESDMTELLNNNSPDWSLEASFVSQKVELKLTFVIFPCLQTLVFFLKALSLLELVLAATLGNMHKEPVAEVGEMCVCTQYSRCWGILK